MRPLNLKDVCSVISAGPTSPQKMWTSSQIFWLPPPFGRSFLRIA